MVLQPLASLPHLKTVDFDSNNFIHDYDFSNRSAADLRAFVQRLEQEAVQEAREVRVMLLGNARAGKTSFALKMENPDYNVPQPIERNIGIHITSHSTEERDGNASVRWLYGILAGKRFSICAIVISSPIKPSTCS